MQCIAIREAAEKGKGILCMPEFPQERSSEGSRSSILPFPGMEGGVEFKSVFGPFILKCYVQG